jgi:hypothetical protein
MQTKDADYIASECDMLTWLYGRNFTGTAPEVKYFKTNTVYTYDMDKLEDSFDEEPFQEKKAQPVLAPVITDPTLSGQKQSPGTTKKRGILGGFDYQDKVMCVPQKTIVSSTHYHLEVEIQGSIIAKGTFPIPIKDMSLEEFEDLAASELLSGIVYGTSTRNGVTTIMLSDPKESEVYTSCNGVQLDSEEFYEHACICSDCGSFIDPNEQDGMFWVRKKKGIIKGAKCMDCVAKSPVLSKYIYSGETHAN